MPVDVEMLRQIPLFATLSAEDLAHASFWQRKLGLCTGKEFVLRLPLPVGKLALPEGH